MVKVNVDLCLQTSLRQEHSIIASALDGGNNQFHASATLLPNKKPPLRPCYIRLGWLQTGVDIWKREISLVSITDRSTVSRLSSPQTRHFTDEKIPFVRISLLFARHEVATDPAS
jgi:hypothetical protein